MTIYSGFSHYLPIAASEMLKKCSPDYATHRPWIDPPLPQPAPHCPGYRPCHSNGHRMRRNRATSAQVRQRIAVALKLKHAGMSENGVCPQWNSHLIGIMISKTIGFRGLANIFRHTHAMPKYPLPVLVQVVAEPWLRPWDPQKILVRKGIGKRCQVCQIPQLSMSCQFLTACDFKLQVHFS